MIPNNLRRIQALYKMMSSFHQVDNSVGLYIFFQWGTFTLLVRKRLLYRKQRIKNVESFWFICSIILLKHLISRCYFAVIRLNEKACYKLRILRITNIYRIILGLFIVACLTSITGLRKFTLIENGCTCVTTFKLNFSKAPRAFSIKSTERMKANGIDLAIRVDDTRSPIIHSAHVTGSSYSADETIGN